MSDMIKCPMGHDNKPGDKFCGTCGAKIGGGEAKCKNCGASNDSGANFCGKCGQPVGADKQVDMKGMQWKRGVDDFATRIDVEDLEGVLKKGVVVGQGTKALLFINGALADSLMPGKYDLGGLKEKLRNFDLSRTSSVILVDSGDVELNLNITGIFTNDPLNIDVACRAVTQIDNPLFFFNNVMKDRRSYLVSEFKNSLYDEMHNALNEIIGKKSVEDLNSNLALKQEFEVFVENHMQTTFQRSGFSFVQLRTVDYKLKGFDKVKGIEQEAFLLISEEEAGLQKRKRLFDVYEKEQLQDIAETTKDLELREKRNKTWSDMRKLVNSDKMDEVKSGDDLEGFMHEVNKGKNLRDEEIKDLTNAFVQSEMSRKFLLNKIDLEQRLELERMDRVGSAETDIAEWEAQAKLTRLKFDESLKKSDDLAESARDNTFRDADTARTISIKDAEAEREQTIKDRQAEHDADEREMELGLKGLDQVKAIKAKHKREEMEIETDKIERLSKLGVEALISGSDSEKAAMLKDLKQTEILKGMTEEQILAMSAKDSDELAKAFQEKFKGLSAEKQEELYKDMMSQKDSSMKTMQEMFNKALETQRDAVTGVAQGVKVLYPHDSQGSGGAGTSSDNLICPKCKSTVKAGTKFCNNCGNDMF